MSLGLEVGILADQKQYDHEGFQAYRQQFDAINHCLASIDLPIHEEPVECAISSWEMLNGISSLYYARRLAAYLELEGKLPTCGNDDAIRDPMLNQYYIRAGHPNGFNPYSPPVYNHLHGSFDHLILHADNEGFYLPLKFDQVIYTPEELGIWGGVLGSSYQLLRECQKIASVLEIPSNITDVSEELWAAGDSQGEGSMKWERYGVESNACVTLIYACRTSIDAGASMVFG